MCLVKCNERVSVIVEFHQPKMASKSTVANQLYQLLKSMQHTETDIHTETVAEDIPAIYKKRAKNRYHPTNQRSRNDRHRVDR